jgi:VanZ family protein
MATPGARERRLWTALAVYLAAIYATLYHAQFVMTWLRTRNLLAKSLLVIFGAAALALALAVLRARPGPRETLLLLAVAALYVFLLSRMEILQERLHILEYGLVGALARGALRERRGRSALEADGPAALGALLLAVAAGWLDEGIQAILPNRVYDLRDVGFNAGAAALAVGALELRRAVRRRERAPAGAGTTR